MRKLYQEIVFKNPPDISHIDGTTEPYPEYFDNLKVREVPTPGRVTEVEIPDSLRQAARQMLFEIKEFTDSIGWNYDLRIERDCNYLDYDRLVTFIDSCDLENIINELVLAETPAKIYAFDPG